MEEEGGGPEAFAFVLDVVECEGGWGGSRAMSRLVREPAMVVEVLVLALVVLLLLESLLATLERKRSCMGCDVTVTVGPAASSYLQ